MKFEVIIGNPPYQENDGGYRASAMPIYHLFIENAIKFEPRYLSMITPSRWFAGGKGLNKFRKKMLNDNRLSVIYDYKDSTSCFKNVAIAGGVNYFLWNKKHSDKCLIVNAETNVSAYRSLNDYDIFIRDNNSIPILEKVIKKSQSYFSDIVYSIKPYGIRTNFKDYEIKESKNTYILYGRNKKGFVTKDKVNDKIGNSQLYKVFLGAAYGGICKIPENITGKPFIGNPNDVCTETYLSVGSFKTEKEALNCQLYMKTKFFRFMLSLRKNTQHISKERFNFVPLLNFQEKWTDEKLYEYFNLTSKEIKYIESVIKEME